MAALVIVALSVLGLVPVLFALSGLAADPSVLLDTLGSGRVWSLWVATMSLGLTVALTSALVGVPVAWAVSRRGGRLASTVATLLPLPLILPPWIAGIAWARLLPLAGFWGAVFLLTVSLWPLVALFALRGFAGAGAASDAALLARGPVAAFRRIEAPLAAPSILAGMLLTFVFAITDFGVVDFLSFTSSDPFVVLASEIFQNWSRLDKAAEAAAVSLPAIVPSLVALFVVLSIERRWSGRWRSASPNRSARRTGSAAGSAALLLVLLMMLAPVLVLAQWALGFEGAVGKLVDVQADAVRSVGAGLGTGVVLAVLGVAAARLSLRLGPRGEWTVLALALLPLAAPGVMMAIGEIQFWNHPANPLSDAVYPSLWLLVLATSGRFLALGVLAARALLVRMDRAPDEAAQLVGRPGWQRLVAIDLPRLAPAVGLSLALGYLLSLRELDVVVLVPAGTSTLSHRIFSMVHFARDELTATLCLLLVGLVIVPAVAARLFGVPGVDCGPSSRRP